MSAVATWPGRAESWLDSHGKGAWIAAMVLGFILFWPVGLAILFYMIWGKKMFGKGCAHGANRMHQGGFATSGNMAFDDFLRRLRETKDKAEFDSFMDERARRRSSERAEAE